MSFVMLFDVFSIFLSPFVRGLDFQFLFLHGVRLRTRLPSSLSLRRDKLVGQATAGGWLGMTYNREFKEFREFREFAVDCTLSQAYIFAPA